MAVLRMADGTRISVPDDITESEAHDVFDAHDHEVTRRDARQTFDNDSTSTMDRVGIGIAKPVVKTYLGLKGLVTDLSDEDRANLSRLDQTHGVASGAGEVAGNLAMLAVPGGVVGKAATRGATMLPSALARLVPAAADIATNAGMEALKAPGEGESRLGNAAGAALGTVGGRAVGGALGRLSRPLEASSPEAKQLLAQGVPLTPGQARGGVSKWLEGKLADIPGVGNLVRARQGEAVEAWNRNIINGSIPQGEVSAAGNKAFQEGQQAFDAAYSSLWSRPLKINGEAVDGTLLGQADDELRKRAVAAMRAGDYEAAQAANAERQSLRDKLPQDFNDEWNRIDSLYRRFSTARKAASYKSAAQAEGVFTPDQLLGAAITKDRSAGKAATAAGRAVMQPEATSAGRVLNSGAGLSTTEGLGLGYGLLHTPGALAAAIPAALMYTKPGMGAIRGLDAAGQRAAELLRKSGLPLPTAGAIGASLEEE